MAGVKGRSGRKPGTPGTGGRPKGSPNKISRNLKEMILGALGDVGGQAYLKGQAETNPNAFLSLVGRVLPMTHQGDKDNPVETVVRIKWGE